MNKDTTVVKATTKGQITLPKKWRDRFNTDRFLIHTDNEKLEVKPLKLPKLKANKEYTVFDAIRDNRGKGIQAKDLKKLLEKLV